MRRFVFRERELAGSPLIIMAGLFLGGQSAVRDLSHKVLFENSIVDVFLVFFVSVKASAPIGGDWSFHVPVYN